jgi:hypothetical protein
MATKYDGKDLTFTVDGVEFNADGTSVVMDSEDADTDSTTFAELADGTPQQWFFQLTALQDYAAASFWHALWDNAGSEVAFIFNPKGGPVAAGKPSFTGTCTIPRKPPVGGDAGTTWTFDFRLDIDGTPVLDETP